MVALKRIQEFTPDRPAELKRQLGQMEENVQAALVAIRRPTDLQKIYVRRSEEYQLRDGQTAVCDDGSSPRLTVVPPPADFRRFVVVKKQSAGSLTLVGAECLIDGAPAVTLSDLGAYEYLAIDGGWIRAPSASGGGGTGAGYGPFASRPAPGTPGAIYYAPDAALAEWVDDGTAWRPVVGGVLGVEVPSLANFNAAWTILNPGATGLAVNAGPGGSLLVTGGNEVTPNLRGWTLPGAASVGSFIEIGFSDLTLVARLGDRYVLFGIGMRESATGKAVCIRLNRNISGTGLLDYLVTDETWIDATTRGSFDNRLFSIAFESGASTFLRVERTASGVDVKLSRDRSSWLLAKSYTMIPAFTTAPDQLLITPMTLNVGGTGLFQITHLLTG